SKHLPALADRLVAFDVPTYPPLVRLRLDNPDRRLFIGLPISVLHGGHILHARPDGLWTPGPMVMFAMILMWIYSVLPIRKRFYGAFLLGHILFAIITPLGCWYHVSIFMRTLRTW